MRLEDDQLIAEAPGLPTTRLIPVAEHRFSAGTYDIQYRFNINAAGDIDSVSMNRFGQETSAPKID